LSAVSQLILALRELLAPSMVISFGAICVTQFVAMTRGGDKVVSMALGIAIVLQTATMLLPVKKLSRHAQMIMYAVGRLLAIASFLLMALSILLSLSLAVC